MKKLVFLFIYLICSQLSINAQNKPLTINFVPSWAGQPIDIPSSQFDEKNKDSIQIESLRYYLSNIQLVKKNKVVWSEQNSYHLIDSESADSQILKLAIPKKIKYTTLRFQLGIDSTTNVSGAMGGDLDPTKGMFWSWNTGYINFKLEGSNQRCPTRKNQYQFHLGGYAYPNASIQQVELKVVPSADMVVGVNLDQFFDQINLQEQNSTMTPGPETQHLIQIAKEIFNVK